MWATSPHCLELDVPSKDGSHMSFDRELASAARERVFHLVGRYDLLPDGDGTAYMPHPAIHTGRPYQEVYAIRSTLVRSRRRLRIQVRST